MSGNALSLPKSLIIFAICVPVALVVGYLMATPTDVRSFSLVGLLLVALCIPVLLRWHHTALLFAWNANMTVFFLPGTPSLWMLFAGVSLFLTVMACVMEKQLVFQNVPSITLPLLALTMIVIVTAKLTGGIGLRSLGGDTYGGKKFVYVLASVIGYFALSSHPIRLEKANRYTGLFFLSAVTGIASNLIYLGGPSFYFLYLFFPTDNALGQAMEDFAGSAADVRFGRLPGVTAAAMGGVYFLLSRFGIRGTLVVSKPGRWLLLLGCFALSLLGGFRSAIIIFILVCAAQFYFEGLFRTRLFGLLIIGAVLGGTFLSGFSTKLPLSVQRSLSIVPAIEIDPAAKENAQASTEWRLQMWRMLLPQVRQYFLLGKGYALDPTDLYLTDESVKRGLADSYEGAMVAGDYHSGPLSVIIPFGIFGLGAFLWLLIAGGRVLYRNHRYSDPALQKINTFLLAYFIARAVFYFVGFGAFSADLPLFLGVLGLSSALNGGVRKSKPVLPSVRPEPAFLPAAAGG